MPAARRLRVDWPACKANGVCAEVLPDLVRLDEWGYPLIAVKPVPVSMAKQAERAVRAVPDAGAAPGGDPATLADQPRASAARVATGGRG